MFLESNAFYNKSINHNKIYDLEIKDSNFYIKESIVLTQRMWWDKPTCALNCLNIIRTYQNKDINPIAALIKYKLYIENKYPSLNMYEIFNWINEHFSELNFQNKIVCYKRQVRKPKTRSVDLFKH